MAGIAGTLGAVVGALLIALSKSVLAAAAPLSMALSTADVAFAAASGIACAAGVAGAGAAVVDGAVGAAELSLLPQPTKTIPPKINAAIRIDVLM